MRAQSKRLRAILKGRDVLLLLEPDHTNSDQQPPLQKARGGGGLRLVYDTGEPSDAPVWRYTRFGQRRKVESGLFSHTNKGSPF